MKILYAEGLTSPEIEIVEGGTMLDNRSKHADLKIMLDSNRENIKMDAMKRIINMVARGKDVSELFPAVVKNVAVKNLELKKLVYVYLVRYAEEQQDLALLSISTFQRALKDPNQLIRASALRVLSSIRVEMIAPIMLLAIKESVRDMSAYVRKVAAHAIPKLFALDPDLQPQLLECIDYLLGDKRTLVLGSAVHAFEETCPDRLDLLHRHFRSLCRALADVDEWGQIVMIGLLTRYARTQFVSPLDNDDQITDPDHNLLIMSAKPLLQSRNCAVVMTVAQLLYYIAPLSQLSIVPRALVRLLRGPNEVQYVILVNIATICAVRNNMVNEKIFAISKNLFEPFLKSFFVRSSDTTHVKQLKLQILTSLVSETNVQLVIRELQAYLPMNDLASSAIEAIGRCALQVPSTAETCLTCLINLISSNKEHIVCSAVIVLKRLLHASAPLLLLKRVLKLIESVKAPTARACVIWMVETHSDKINYLVPDLLRKLAKSFPDEPDCVKLQTMNLAVRLWITDRERCELLIRYVMQLARYDRSYDIRDRCRFLRNFLFNRLENSNRLPLEIFLSKKPAPLIQSQFSDRERFQLGTLSHLLNQKCLNYTDLPDFPIEALDPTTRGSALSSEADEEKVLANQKKTSNLESEKDVEDEEEESEEDEEDEDEEGEESESEDNDEEEDESTEESSEEENKVLSNNKKNSANSSIKKESQDDNKQKNGVDESVNLVDLLIDVDFSVTSTNNSGATFTSTNFIGFSAKAQRSLAQYVNNEYFRILSPMNTGGLSVEGRYGRGPSSFNSSMVPIELLFTYRNPKISEADIFLKNCSELLSSGSIDIQGLKENERRIVYVSIDFGDSSRSSEWNFSWSFNNKQNFNYIFEAPFGEQIEPIDLKLLDFKFQKAQLAGMNQIQQRLTVKPKTIKEIYKLANCKQVQSTEWCFAAQTVSRKDIVLISIIDYDQQPCSVMINCENITFGSLLCKEIQNAFDE